MDQSFSESRPTPRTDLASRIGYYERKQMSDSDGGGRGRGRGKGKGKGETRLVGKLVLREGKQQQLLPLQKRSCFRGLALLAGGCCFTIFIILLTTSPGIGLFVSADSKSVVSGRRFLVKRSHNHHHNQHHNQHHNHHNYQHLQQQLTTTATTTQTVGLPSLVEYGNSNNEYTGPQVEENEIIGAEFSVPPLLSSSLSYHQQPPSQTQIINSNHHLHKQQLRHHYLRQQVPERLPIVVSSSDNSYVSASPIAPPQPITTTTTTTITKPALEPRADAMIRRRNYHQNSEGQDHEEDDDDDDDINRREDDHNDVDAGDDNDQEQDRADDLRQIKSTKRNNAQYTDAGKLDVDAYYRIRSATIIKTRESIDMGATFLNYTIVTNLNACLVECWITDSCDTAIYQESPVDYNNHLPYLTQSQEHNSLASLTSSSNSFRRRRRSSSIGSSSSSSETGSIVNNSGFLSSSSLLSSKIEGVQQASDGAGENLDTPGDDDTQQQQSSDNEIDSKGNFMMQTENRGEDLDNNNNNNQVMYRAQFGRKLPEVGFFICYLFECAKLDGFKCQFSSHNYYVSSTKRRSRHTDDIVAGPTTNNNIQQHSTTHFEVMKKTIGVDEPHYSRIVNSHHHLSFNGKGRHTTSYVHDSHIASISIGHEEYDQYGRGGINSAIIAIMFGIGATGMLIVIVGHKMKSIRKRLAHKGRRRSLVPDADFLINTIPI